MTPVLAGRHESADHRERFEVAAFPRHQWVPLEVRDDVREDVLESSCLPLHGLVAAVRTDASAPEERLDRMKHLGAISILANGEARPHLPTHEQFPAR